MCDIFQRKLSKFLLSIYVILMLICTCNSVYDYYEGDYEGDYEEESDEISTTILPNEVSDVDSLEGKGKD